MWCAGTLYAVSVQERGFVASSTKGAGAKSSGFTGQSVDKVAAGGASEWEVGGWCVCIAGYYCCVSEHIVLCVCIVGMALCYVMLACISWLLADHTKPRFDPGSSVRTLMLISVDANEICFCSINTVNAIGDLLLSNF